jgi:urease accessory protein
MPNVAWAALAAGRRVTIVFDGSAVTSVARGYGWRGWFGIPWLPAMSLVNAASFVVLGLLLAAARRLPLPVLIALGAVFGISHGYENGRAMAPDTAVHLFVLGVAAVGGLVTALVSAATIDLAAAAWARVAVRIVGSWIAAIGIMTIGLAWRPM